MKRRKLPKKVSISQIKYLEQDLQAVLKLIERYKKNAQCLKKPNIRRSQVKKYLKNLGEWADKTLELVEKPVTPAHLRQINCRFYKYYSIKSWFGEGFNYNKDTEKKLDILVKCAAIWQCGNVWRIRERLANPECITIKPFLREAEEYFFDGIKHLDEIRNTVYELNAIDSEVSGRIEKNAKQPFKRMFYIHAGKTNSGKTYTALQMLKNADRGAYLSPLRLLALEVCDSLNNEGVPCSLVTGEEEMLVENAKHISSTVELANFNTEYDVAVIDECQMIADFSRGPAWTKAITNIHAREICLCTAPEAVDMLIKLIDSCGDYYEVVNHRRKTPLVVEDKPFCIDDVQPGDALVAFSKQKVNAIGAQLIKKGVNVSVLYGALPYTVRKQQFENFTRGISSVLVTTDAIGMGVNLPVRRIVFMELYKFDGKTNRLLNPSEIKQIAGRAGRRGKFDTGFVNANSEGELEHIRKSLAAKGEKVRGICVNFPKRILDDERIDLKTAVKAWGYYDVPGYYIKENLIQTEKNIKYITRLYNRLNIEKNKANIFEMASMPVDVRTYGIKELWLEYIEQRLLGCKELRKPYIKRKSVEDYLIFSKMLDTYFMCSKSWGMNVDFEWLERKREQCNEALIKGLIDDVGSYTRHCSMCGKLLDWNNNGGVCSQCTDNY